MAEPLQRLGRTPNPLWRLVLSLCRSVTNLRPERNHREMDRKGLLLRMLRFRIGYLGPCGGWERTKDVMLGAFEL